MKELNFIDEFYNKIKGSMNKNTPFNKVITMQYKIDVYTKLYEFCTDDDINTEFVYQKYEDQLRHSIPHQSYLPQTSNQVHSSPQNYIIHYQLLVDLLL